MGEDVTEKHPAIPFGEAQGLAQDLLTALVRQGGITSGAIAGSIRRMKPEVHDLEIVAVPVMREAPGRLIPTLEPDLGAIREILEQCGWSRAPPNKAGAKAPWGPRYLKAALSRGNGSGVQLDLFLVYPPSTWGVIYFIRTGDKDWSHHAVKRLWRYGLRVEDGRVWDKGGRSYECPEEECFFKFLGVPWVPPNKRDWSLPETRALMEGG